MLKPWSFPQNRAPKMRERHELFFGLRLMSKEFQSRNPNQNRAVLWRIFSSNKSAPAYRKTRFYANCDPNKQEVGFIFAWSGSELWSLFKYSRVKLKNQKLIVVDVHFKAYRYPMVPLSCRSNLTRRTFKIHSFLSVYLDAAQVSLNSSPSTNSVASCFQSRISKPLLWQ